MGGLGGEGLGAVTGRDCLRRQLSTDLRTVCVPLTARAQGEEGYIRISRSPNDCGIASEALYLELRA